MAAELQKSMPSLKDRGCSGTEGEHSGHEENKGVVIQLGWRALPVNTLRVGERVRESSLPNGLDAGEDALLGVRGAHEASV